MYQKQAIQWATRMTKKAKPVKVTWLCFMRNLSLSRFVMRDRRATRARRRSRTTLTYLK